MMIFNSVLSVDKFINKALYNEKSGYYSNKNPLGKAGDFITAPKVSPIFCEIIIIWMISFWIKIGKPKKFSIVELGPGDGTFSKMLLKVSKKFPSFKESLNLYLFEKSKKLIKVQKKNIKDKGVLWIKNFNEIKSYPVLFFGNEFFDAIPIKQFKKEDNIIYERYLSFNKNKFENFIYKKISKNTHNILKKFNLHKTNGIIEYPKEGFKILEKISKKLKKNSGGILLIDYGYLNSNFTDTLQSVKEHKKNKIFHNIGKADITYLVNFKLLRKFFKNNNLFSSNIVDQSFFLKKLGIIERANILSKKMSFKEKSDLYYRIDRLLNEKKMGKLFKVLFASCNKIKFDLGFK